MTAHATCLGAHEENHPARVGTCLFGALNLKGNPFPLSHKFCLDMECNNPKEIIKKKNKKKSECPVPTSHCIPHIAFRLFTLVLETCFVSINPKIDSW